jgi:hypothetical protein
MHTLNKKIKQEFCLEMNCYIFEPIGESYFDWGFFDLHNRSPHEKKFESIVLSSPLERIILFLELNEH